MRAHPEPAALLLGHTGFQPAPSSRSVTHKRLYKLLKGMVIMASALTPICAALHLLAAITGSLDVSAVIIESIQQRNQHHQNWLTYRLHRLGVWH